ncbi:uncharacterized protein LOC143037030 [Oratosquilla oratoria]|uniref:uncharacterized protein LOC143037030 n=1 Tax=Oratosquilla oratoria TaxID=337810 RepID=UPI003F7595BF
MRNHPYIPLSGNSEEEGEEAAAAALLPLRDMDPGGSAQRSPPMSTLESLLSSAVPSFVQESAMEMQTDQGTSLVSSGGLAATSSNLEGVKGDKEQNKTRLCVLSSVSLKWGLGGLCVKRIFQMWTD